MLTSQTIPSIDSIVRIVVIGWGSGCTMTTKFLMAFTVCHALDNIAAGMTGDGGFMEKNSTKAQQTKLLQHVDSEHCWCCPRLEYRDPETDNEVWVHNEREDAN